MRILCIAFLLSCSGLLAQPSIKKGKATATGDCSVAHSGNNDTIIIKNCGIGQEQGTKIIEILKQIIADKDQGHKLDEILAAIKHLKNPYEPVTTYAPNGLSRTFVASSGMTNTSQEAEFYAQRIDEAWSNHDWESQIAISKEASQKYPGWFSPSLAMGYAYLMLCRKDQASSYLSMFIKATEGAVDYAKFRKDAEGYFSALESQQYKSTCAARGAAH